MTLRLSLAFLFALAPVSVFAFTEPTVVEFHIAAGTGSSPWNTVEKPVEVRVGDILRLINDDQVAHLLHTPGKPCPHGTKKFLPGESYDCKIVTPADPETTKLYDHHFGSGSRFYVRAIP